MAHSSHRGSGGSGSKRQSGSVLYKQRRKQIAQYVVFKLPKPGTETPAARRKALRYFRYLIKDDSQPGIATGIKAKVWRKDKKKLRALQRSVGQGDLPGIKYAFVPSIRDKDTGQVEGVKIKQRPDELPVIQVGAIFSVVQAFDIDAMMADPEAEIEATLAVLDSYSGGSKIARYRPASGDHGQTRLYQAYTRREIVQALLRLLFRYGSMAKKRNGQSWDNWLYGLGVEWSNSERSMQDFENAYVSKREARQQIKKLRNDYFGLLDVLKSAGGRSHINNIAQMFAGRVLDPNTRTTLAEMAKAKLVKTDGDSFMITRHGQRYWKEMHAVQEKLNRI